MRAGHRKRPAAPRPSGIILIAEDQPDLRYLYAAYFHLGNFRVETAVDGQQAFEMAVDLRPDVIVLNLDLPRVDGWELTQRLKSDRRTGHIPVIACSGYTFGRSIDRLRRQALLAGGAHENRPGRSVPVRIAPGRVEELTSPLGTGVPRLGTSVDRSASLRVPHSGVAMKTATPSAGSRAGKNGSGP